MLIVRNVLGYSHLIVSMICEMSAIEVEFRQIAQRWNTPSREYRNSIRFAPSSQF